jgi:type II secretory pathway pseudopilin PulG
VVLAIIGILAGLLLPALSRAKEKAKVAKIHAELYGIGMALHMYADDQAGKLPPVRVNCNSDLSEHWCQLPTELAAERYLPRSDQGGGRGEPGGPVRSGPHLQIRRARTAAAEWRGGGRLRALVADEFPQPQ